MQPLTPDRLAANAFRTLGLGGGAAQADVEAAARRMRIWPDPSRVPPTPWDVPALGRVARGRGDVEAAVERLRRPQTRLEDRLAWYASAPRPAGAAAAGDDGVGDEASTVAAAHDAAVAALHAAWAADPAAADADRWADVMRRLAALASSGAYVGWVAAAERAGGFEIPATPAEATEAARAVPGALAQALAIRARDALNRGDAAACGRIGAVVRAAGTHDPGVAAAVRDLLDGVEDLLAVHCRSLDEQLGNSLYEHERFQAENRQGAQAGEAVWRKTVRPAYDALVALAGDPDDGRLVRSRDRCAEVLTLLAYGWELGGRYAKAERSLVEALELAGDGPSERKAMEALDRVAPSAAFEHKRAPAGYLDPEPARRAPAYEDRLDSRSHREPAAASPPATQRLAWILLFVVIGAVSSMARTNCRTDPGMRPVVDRELYKIPPAARAPDERQRNTQELLESMRRNRELSPELSPDVLRIRQMQEMAKARERRRALERSATSPSTALPDPTGPPQLPELLRENPRDP